ncbi:MAG: alpha-amylase family glycosyl hydrolase [bacterium]
MTNDSHKWLKLSFRELKEAMAGDQDFPARNLEFHVSRTARRRYEFEEHFFALTGNVIFANFHAARVFAQRMNARRDLVQQPESAIKAGHINAMGLIDEMLHYVVALYCQQVNPQAFAKALAWLETELGVAEVDKTLQRFVDAFPPLAVYKGEMNIRAYLVGSSKGVSNREIVLEEMVLLWLANLNPAFAPFLELFDDTPLKQKTAYGKVMQSLNEFFETQPHFGPDDQNLIQLLRTPALHSPHSLEAQLLFMRRRWGLLLGKYLHRLLGSLDFLKEETRAVFWGPPPTEILQFEGGDHEAEQFSADLHWMPRLVLLAKSTLVWLDQLSKKYQRAISRLDQIPDEELDTLARWGFTGLWLIGIFERSGASRKIKQMCGNPEAESSAYSLFDYEISHELGGYDALQNLKQRCWHRGIRLACDMVPNHTGIDSRWIREQPDWFISLPYSPFPSYSFSGPNLMDDPRYGIFIEDKYFSRTDAAVVFKRVDYWNNDVRYIYHGNDGTNMPWNDTAQLNYLNPEVREAMIQKILNVARMFPIIRFDAAMTLTKKHYQRLWYPEPGHGGDIPSRADHGLPRSLFNKAMPKEFWREVVDRVTQEVPDTLLLAEAFWLMEGFFVRTLGMHRVYNSAFMNMLKNEENAKYRQTIKNTIQFNPEILKRYVNFLNNPDEETAVAQFGKGDKYFGICIMMVTMPGLPMFGHGQIEGFAEKYGMEYRRAYWDEGVDWSLVQRHEREVFPLMKRRYLFAEVENFLLYDFYTPEGHVNENVFAYSNRFDDERALVVYNNKYEHARGWIRIAVPYRASNNGDSRLVHKTLGEAFSLHPEANTFCVFRDQISGLEYIRSSRELCERGLYVELGAFKYAVFLEFSEVRDNVWRHYAQLTEYLNGRGVPNILEALKELHLKPLLEAVDTLLNPEMVKRCMAARSSKNNKRVDNSFVADFQKRHLEIVKQAKKFSAGKCRETQVSNETRLRLEAALRLDDLNRRFGSKNDRKYEAALKYLRGQMPETSTFWAVAFGWLVIHQLGKVLHQTDFEQQSRSWIDEWLLGKRTNRLFLDLGTSGEQVSESTLLVKILTSEQCWFLDRKPRKARAQRILHHLLQSQDIQQYLRVNRYDGVLWFNKENFEKLLWWLFAIAAVQITACTKAEKAEIARELADVFAIVQKWLQAEKLSEYKVGKLLEAAKGRRRVVKSPK